MEYLLLDPSIRDWVVLPMVIILIFVGMGRHYVQQLIKSSDTLQPEPLRHKQTAMHAQKLRMNGKYLSEDAYSMRKVVMCRKKTGILREKVPGPPNPMSNPSAMVDMLKGNLTFMLPNIVMMAFVSYFFAGFVLVKMPFPLPSNRFKLMLQRGIDLSSLDVSYVSSLSWYFLVTFGLRGIYRLILGEDADTTSDMQMQMQMGMGGSNANNFDAANAYRHERELLQLAKHTFVGDKAEMDLLGSRYPTNSTTNLLDLSKMTSKNSKTKAEKPKATEASGATTKKNV